jgi:hypothetical protein
MPDEPAFDEAVLGELLQHYRVRNDFEATLRAAYDLGREHERLSLVGKSAPHHGPEPQPAPHHGPEPQPQPAPHHGPPPEPKPSGRKGH